MYSDDFLVKMHKASFNNQELIKKSEICGCFYCGTLFRPMDIKEYLSEQNGGNTAVCPYCHIDSVIANFSRIEITKELLKAMNNKFF